MHLLITRPGAIGDTLLTFPVLRALRTQYSNPHITLVSNAAVLPLTLDFCIGDEVSDYGHPQWSNLFLMPRCCKWPRNCNTAKATLGTTQGSHTSQRCLVYQQSPSLGHTYLATPWASRQSTASTTVGAVDTGYANNGVLCLATARGAASGGR